MSNSCKDFGIDIDGVGGDDWKGRIGANAYGAFAHVNSLGGTVAANGGITPPAIDLSYGFSVGPTLASGVFNDRGVRWYRYSFSTADGPFFNSTTGYLGLRFDGDTGAVGTQYAWVKVHFDFAALKLTMNILEWAYDNSGAPIKVGDTGARVPAPATALLTLLGLGAMGVAAYRRRREEGLKRLAEEQGSAAEAG